MSHSGREHETKILVFKKISDNPPIIWDNQQSMGVNILANLGYFSVGESPGLKVSISEKKGRATKVVNEPEDAKLYADYWTNMKKRHPEEVELIRKAIMQESVGDEVLLKLSRDENRIDLLGMADQGSGSEEISKILPEKVEQLFNRLHNQDKSGGPDHLYAILQYARQLYIQDAYQRYEKQHQAEEAWAKRAGVELLPGSSANELHAEVEDRYEKLQIERLKLLNKADEAKGAVHKEKERRVETVPTSESDVQRAIAEYDEKIKWLKEKNEQLTNDINQLNKQKSGSETEWGEWFDSNFDKITSLLSGGDTIVNEYAEGRLDQLNGWIRQKQASTSEVRQKMLELNAKKTKLTKAKARNVLLNDAVGEIENQLSEMNALISSAKQSKVSKEVAGISPAQIVISTADSKKAFLWDARKFVGDNLKILLPEYLESPGYHTRDRKESAQAVLKHIEEVAKHETDPMRRDLEIIRFIGVQKTKLLPMALQKNRVSFS